MKTSSNYNYPKFKEGHRFVIRSDNSKNAISLEGEIVEDEGGATALVKLDNRAKPIPIHKGMLFAPKYSEPWKLLNNTDRDFSQLEKVDEAAAHEVEPISKRLRSKTSEPNKASAARMFYMLRKSKNSSR